MELFNRHQSFLALSCRGALSVLDASFKFARASGLSPENHGRLRAWNKEHLWQSLSLPQ